MAGKAKNRGVPGNTLEEQRVFDEMVMRAGRAWLTMARAVDGLLDEGVVVTRISVKGDWRVPGDMLVIITAASPDGPVVLFHRVDEVVTLWQGLSRRLLGSDVGWKVDEYAK